MEKAESIALIRSFIEACVRADPDEFAGYFTEDATWWNAPWKPIQGREAIRETLRRGAEQMAALPWEIVHIVADGDLVMAERVDSFRVGETRISVPLRGRVRVARRKDRGVARLLGPATVRAADAEATVRGQVRSRCRAVCRRNPLKVKD